MVEYQVVSYDSETEGLLASSTHDSFSKGRAVLEACRLSDPDDKHVMFRCTCEEMDI